jgi:hypothetical protein
MVDTRRADSIGELARDATQVREPGRALRAIADLRVRLDDLEAFHVDNALARGWSWTQIAQPLGVSRQAAHKRHGARGRNGAAGERLTVTVEARRAVVRARREAAARGDRAVAAPHLLLALLDPDAGRAASVLRRLGIGRDEIVAELPRAPARRQGVPQISPELHRALGQSLTEALRTGSDRIAPEHLLLALLRQPGGAANRVLRRVSADASNVSAGLSDALPNLSP